MTKILFISDGLSFMTNAIVKSFKDARYDVIPIPMDEVELKLHRNDADLIVFYLGDYIDQKRQDMLFLKELCVDDHKLLCLLGNDSELSLVKNTIPEEFIAAEYTRPLDMKSIVSDLGQLSLKSVRMRNKKTILLVDDDSTFLKMMHGWLSGDYRVTIVNSGMQAITYLATNQPDLILLDYEMPVTSGPQVLEMIRSEELTAHTPVFFLTGKSDRESVEKVLKLGPDGYLLKTIGKEEILEKLHDFFAG